jgi:tetratricopeptide (TPR) repeat protein
MTTQKQDATEAEQKNDYRRMLVAVSVIICGLVFAVFLARWIDARRPAPDLQVEEERLYLTGNTLKRASLGFNGLAADWYWMRSLQYVGRKFLKAGVGIQLDDLSQLNLKLLTPLLETATTLDPEFQEPYEYAAVVLPAIDVQEAIRIIRKGIVANPSKWRLYQHLGYIYWQQRDFKAAGEAYGQGATLPGAPAWMQAMKARMASEGGSRNLAREIYAHMYEQAGDPAVKEMARGRLLQLDSLDERDALRRLLVGYKAEAGRCAADWKEVEPALRSLRVPMDISGAPLDPSGKPYVLVSADCEIDLDPKSEILRR